MIGWGDWVVDPELDAVKVYRRVEGAFVRSLELTTEHMGSRRHVHPSSKSIHEEFIE